ncbi:MAG TPA: hypothetical protein EYH08_00590 [Pyrodictium sp.]|nr:hypothetical protein [Pyrodictium sp.]
MVQRLIKDVNIVAIPLASKVHGEEYYRNVLGVFERVLKALGVKFVDVVDSEEVVDGIAKRDVDAVLLIFLTGGTSRLGRLVARKFRDKPLVLIGHTYHNSVASMASVYSRLASEGGYNLIPFVYRGGDSIIDLTRIYKAVRAAVALRKMRVVQLDADKLDDEGILFSEKIGASVVLVSRNELRKRIEEVKTRASRELKRLVERYDLGGIDRDKLVEPFALYVVAEKIVEEFNAHAVTINCFPFILEFKFTPCIALSMLLDEGVPAACEADYRALTLLALAQLLTGKPGWIGNFTDYDPVTHQVTFSHCTVATSITEHSTLVSHFETGTPYAVEGRLRKQVYTIAAISPDYSTMAVAKAELLESGMLTGGRCRTQAILKVEEVDPRPLTEKLVSNHHVLMVGDVRYELSIVAKVFGMKFVEY